MQIREYENIQTNLLMARWFILIYIYLTLRSLMRAHMAHGELLNIYLSPPSPFILYPFEFIVGKK